MGNLNWWFYCPQSQQWQPDPHVMCTDAPRVVHVLGREDHLPNARICGTYHLGHSHDGQPMYHKPGTCSVLRYSAQNHWWIIDCDYMTEPTVASRLYQWIFNGNRAQADDKCHAYAEATNSPHPGDCNLIWNVYDPRAKGHAVDTRVICTTAALKLTVASPGADILGTDENADIFGTYDICGTCCQRPYYMMSQQVASLVASSAAYLYYRKRQGWVISRQSPADAQGAVVAFALDVGTIHQEPVKVSASSWRKYSMMRGSWCQTVIHIEEAMDAPTDMLFDLDPRAAAELAANTAKRRKLEGNTSRMPGALARVFGGA